MSNLTTLTRLGFYGILSSISLLPARAQHYRHVALWTRLTPSVDVSKRLTLSADFYFRQQNDPRNSRFNLIDAPLTRAVRVGATYRIGNWALYLSPLTLFRSYAPLGKPADYAKPPNREYRVVLTGEWGRLLTRRLALRLRSGYEFRHFRETGNAGRLRFRALVRYGLPRHYFTTAWNETLLLAPPHLPNGWHALDINRSALSLGRDLTKHLTVEGGYQFSYRQRRTLTEVDEEHALSLALFVKW